MCNKVNNCIHSEVDGREATELLEVIKRRPESICDDRKAYVKRIAAQYQAWTIEEIGEETFYDIEADIREQLQFLWYGEEGEVRGDLVDLHEGMGDLILRMEDEEDMHHIYQGDLWNTLRRGTSRHWQEWRVSCLSWAKDAIERECKIADILNYYHRVWLKSNKRLPKSLWKHVVKARTRISQLQKDNLLTWAQFSILTNWCNELTGSPVRFTNYNKDEELETLVGQLVETIYEQDDYRSTPKDDEHDEVLAWLVYEAGLQGEAPMAKSKAPHVPVGVAEKTPVLYLKGEEAEKYMGSLG